MNIGRNAFNVIMNIFTMQKIFDKSGTQNLFSYINIKIINSGIFHKLQQLQSWVLVQTGDTLNCF